MDATAVMSLLRDECKSLKAAAAETAETVAAAKEAAAKEAAAAAEPDGGAANFGDEGFSEDAGNSGHEARAATLEAR